MFRLLHYAVSMDIVFIVHGLRENTDRASCFIFLHVHTHIYKFAHVHTHTRTHTNTHPLTHTHARTHARTHSPDDRVLCQVERATVETCKEGLQTTH